MNRNIRPLSTGVLRTDVRLAYQAGYGELANLVTAALDGEDTTDLVDFDDLIGFGMFCGEVCPGLDWDALSWAERQSSERRLDVLCGFLTGYWKAPVARDAINPHLLDRILALRERTTLAPDSATGSIMVTEAALSSRSIHPEQRAALASRLLHIIDSETEYRHNPIVRLRLKNVLRHDR